ESIRSRDARRGTAERERTRQAERREDRQYRERERRESRERTEESQLEALRRSLMGTGMVGQAEVQTADRPELMRIQGDVSELKYRRGRIKGLQSEIATERTGVEKGQERDALEAEWAEMEGDPSVSAGQSSAALRVMNRKRRGLFTRGARLQDQGFRARKSGESIEEYLVTARKGLDERERLGKQADRKEIDRRAEERNRVSRVRTANDLGFDIPLDSTIGVANKTIRGYRGSERDRKVVEALGASTKGFRRAGMEWGIGRYLWFLEGFWVQMQDKKILKLPDIGQEKFWWALPYDHHVAKEKWLDRNGAPVKELGPDPDFPRAGTKVIIQDDGSTGESGVQYSASDILSFSIRYLKWDSKTAREWLEEHEAMEMSYNEMQGVLEEQHELMKAEEMQHG
ncbi:hypothetical protein LCGC14_2424500, partial [marine sediment metagenome]